MSTKTKQKLFEELQQHLLEDARPSEYISEISKLPLFQEFPFQLLHDLKNTEQSAIHHPEGSVWNHTLLVVDEAALVKDQSEEGKAFMWAALLHDIGKPETSRYRKGKITAYNHDTLGAVRAEEFLREFSAEDELIRRVTGLIRYHMHMLYVLKKLPFGNPERMLQEVAPREIALLCRCDRLGRAGVDRQEEEKNYREFYQIISKSNR